MALNWIEGVLNRSKHTGTDLLLMVLLAEAADRDTGSCYPGIKTLARLMRTSERNVQYRLKVLRESGELDVRRQKSPYGTNLYVLSRSLLEGEAQFVSASVEDAGGEVEFTPETTGGEAQFTPGGEAYFTPLVKPTSPKPSVEPSEEIEGDKSPYSLDFEAFWKLTNKKGSKPLAFKVWIGKMPTATGKMTAADRAAASAAVPAWTSRYPSLGFEYHVVNWLKQRIWESDLPSARAQNGKYIHQRDNLPDQNAEMGWSSPDSPWKGKVIRVGPKQ
jgi:hypothetical protein